MILNEIDDDPLSTYINASFIKVFQLERHPLSCSSIDCLCFEDHNNVILIGLEDYFACDFSHEKLITGMLIFSL